MKLIEKLCVIMESVDRIPKNGVNTAQKYNYATEADVSDHVRKLLAKQKVFLLSDVVKVEIVTRTGINDYGKEFQEIFCTVQVKYTFFDGESEDKLEVMGYGTGVNRPGDKAIYIALTGSLKYLLMKSFLIPTGDDPEKDDKVEPQDTPKTEKKPATEAVSSDSDLLSNPFKTKLLKQCNELLVGKGLAEWKWADLIAFGQVHMILPMPYDEKFTIGHAKQIKALVTALQPDKVEESK